MHRPGLHEHIQKAISLRESGDPERAGSLLSVFLRKNPDDAEAHYQMAWTCDVRGMEREAIPHYRRALEGYLSGKDRSGAFVGLGSSHRVLGEYGEAVEALRRGAFEFPKDRAIQTFLAMALYNTGEHRESARILLKNLVETTSDPRIKSYEKALRFYPERLDEIRE